MTAPDPTPLAYDAHGTRTGRGHRQLSHLDALESESIHIIREVAAEFERPVLLFSGGKDSAVMLRLAEKAFCAGADPVPGDARRHRAQLPRGARVPRPADRRARRPARRGVGAGRHRRRARGRGDRPGRVAQPAPDVSRCSRRSPSTASTPCSAADAATRRRPGRRSASSPSATSSGSGTRRTSGPSCGTSTTGGTARRAHPRLPALELDRAGRVAVHRRRRRRAPVDLLRAPARGVPPRRDDHGRGRRTSRRRTARSRSRRWCGSARSAT